MIYLNSFIPLASKDHGIKAWKKYNIPPFVDGSCRREPDFESKYPSITALCRGKQFAPRLYPGDIVVYITKQGKYIELNENHLRLVAVLEIIKRFSSHADAAKWYKKRNLPVPSNCMISENKPLPMSKTIGLKQSICNWDAEYKVKAQKCGVFLVCKPLYIELHRPPIITSKMMDSVFKRKVGTQNPGAIQKKEFNQLLRKCRISL